MSACHVCLVRPPTVMPSASVTAAQGVPSIGMAYLASSLKAAGHRVTVVDAFGEAIDQFARIEGTGLFVNGLVAREVVARIPDDVDVIGVSCMFSNEWLYSRLVIQEIAARFPTVPMIGGGEHCTAAPLYSLESAPGLHSVVLGEGEETLIELIDAIRERRSLHQVNGIAFLEEGRLVTTPARARIRAIDDIPWPSWDEQPLEKYLDAGLGMSSLKARSMPMIASRGCPYQCTFCSNPQMWTQRLIARDPETLMAEVRTWVERFRVTHIEFYDLTAIVRRDWMLAFAKLMTEARLGVTWSLPSGTRTEAIDAEVLQALKASGCNALTYAPESGSPATLKRIKKMVDPQRMLVSMRQAVRAGISLKANMIVGFPGQTKSEVAESFAFMFRMAWAGVQDVAVFPFVPYPGSELYDQLVAEGRIRLDSVVYEAFLAGNVYNELTGMLSWSEHLSDRLIKFLTVGGMAWFYAWQFLFRPWRLAVSIGRIVASRPQTMFERTLHVALENFVTRRRKVQVTAVEHVPMSGGESRIRELIGQSVTEGM